MLDDITHAALRNRSLTGSLTAVVRLALQWAGRRRSRRALGMLSAHHLRDIGLDERTARTEAQRRFWQD